MISLCLITGDFAVNFDFTSEGHTTIYFQQNEQMAEWIKALSYWSVTLEFVFESYQVATSKYLFPA